MILEIIIALLLGIFLGIITGLIPGIHINLISVLIIAIAPFLLNYTTPFILVIAIISMAITHTFLDFIPSCFLGAPDPDTALSVLPAHKLLLEGKGYEAVKLATFGSLGGLFLSILLIPLLIYATTNYYDYISKAIPSILILSASFLIIREKKSRIWAFILFMLSGVFGIATLNTPLSPIFS